VEKLRQNPDNIDAREDFARLLAEHLGQVQTALDQVKLLLDMPNQPENKRAQWLGLMAAWQITHLKDTESGKATLQRLVRDFPHTPQAFVAQQRLSTMAVEERLRRARAAAPPPPKLSLEKLS
jgi:hypothetical protein